MRTKVIFIALLFLLFAILAAQNTISAKLNFFIWPIEAPLIVMIVVVFILGLVIGLVSSSLYERRMKKEEIKAKSEKRPEIERKIKIDRES